MATGLPEGQTSLRNSPREQRELTVAKLLSGAVHEVNNALQVISGAVEILQGRTGLGNLVTRALERLRNQSARAASALADVMLFTKSAIDESTRVDIRVAVAYCLGVRRFAINRAGLSTRVDPEPAGHCDVVATRGLFRKNRWMRETDEFRLSFAVRMAADNLRRRNRESGAEPPVSVLIVDDDKAYVDFLRAAFALAEGTRLDLAHVSRLGDVLPALKKKPATVVLLDINLPDGNGLAWLRVNRSRVDSAVIVLTGIAGYAAGPDVVEGAQDFLVKSEVDPEQLARVVQYAADRERARKELVRSREYFQSLIEQARDLITVVDERGIIVYQSPGTKRLLGQPPEDFVGKSLFAVVDDSQAAKGLALLTSVLEGSEDVPTGECTIRRPDGSLRYIDVVASRIASDGGVRRVVLNSRDVTERRRAEEELRVRDEMLLQAQKMEAVGRLAGGIAHDFSNVLTIVTAACERLQDQIVANGTSVREIDMILRNCERAASLVRQLLAFSRQQTLAPRPIDMGRLVGSAGELLDQFLGEHIQLEIEVAPGLHAVEADPGQIEQVLMNLAINARDAMPDGGRLRIRLENIAVDDPFARDHPPQPSGEYVRL